VAGGVRCSSSLVPTSDRPWTSCAFLSAFLWPFCVCLRLCSFFSQAYDGLRKIAGYPSLSDKGGNTDVVTRKVWATLLSMIHTLRPMDQATTEGLMLTDGDDPNRAVVEEVPLLRQAAARRELELTETGNPPPPKGRLSRRRATNAAAATKSTTPATPAPGPRGRTKRPRDAAVSDEHQARRSKTRRTRGTRTVAAHLATASQETGDDHNSDEHHREDEDDSEEDERNTTAAAGAVAAEVESPTAAAHAHGAPAVEIERPPVAGLLADLLDGGNDE